MDQIEIESRTIDGAVYLKATDVATALRKRAGEYQEQTRDAEIELDDEATYAWRCVARELAERADWVDLAVIQHISKEN